MKIGQKINETQVRETGSENVAKTPRTKKSALKTPKEKTRISGEARKGTGEGKSPANLKVLQDFLAFGMKECPAENYLILVTNGAMREHNEALVSMGKLQDLVNPEIARSNWRVNHMDGVQAFLPFASARERGEDSLSGKLLPNREKQISFKEAFDLIDMGQTVTFKPYVWKDPGEFNLSIALHADKSPHRYPVKVHDFKGLNKLAAEALEANPEIETRQVEQEQLSGREIFQEMKEKADKFPRNALFYYPAVKTPLGIMRKISYGQAALRLKAHKPVTFQPMFDRYPGGVSGLRETSKEDVTDPLGTHKVDLLPVYHGTRVKGATVSSFDDLKELRAIEQNYLRLY